MAWADDLPRIKAENEAWRAEHLPRLRAAQERKDRERQQARDLIQRGLAAIGASDADRALVFKLTGVA